MRWMSVLLVFAIFGCGVKGPPEPPLPNEANLEKQTIKDATRDANVTPAGTMTPPDTAPAKKEKDPTTKKKTK